MSFTLKDLDATIGERIKRDPSKSYSAQLVSKGTPHCAQKLGEEAIETVIAAMSGDKVELTKEAADTFYHLLVLLRASSVPLDDVMEELASRTGQTGLEEKNSR